MAKNPRDGLAWDDAPAEEECGGKYRLIRTPAERELKLIIMSKDFIGARVHWIGRTAPCRKTGCALCIDRKEKRWRGWMFAQPAGGDETVIFEFTAPAGKQLDAGFKKYGTLQGLNIVASRPSKRTNGKVHIRVLGLNSEAHAIKEPPLLHDALKLIWGVLDPQPMVGGGMTAQEVSEADLHSREAGKASAGHTNRVPTRSLIPPIMSDPHVVDVDKLIVAIDKINGQELESIRRVNGRQKK